MALAMPSIPQPRVLDTCGQMWVPVFVDCACVPQMACGHACPHRCLCQNQAKGPRPEPGGKGLQSGNTSPIHTGPILSHSHWMDSALGMKLLTRESPAGLQLQVPAPVPEDRGRGLPEFAQDPACSDSRAE